MLCLEDLVSVYYKNNHDYIFLQYENKPIGKESGGTVCSCNNDQDSIQNCTVPLYACTAVNYVTVHLIAVILRNHENLVQLYGLIHKKFNWNCAIRFQIKIMSCACLFNKYNKRYFMYKTTFIFSPVYSECVQMNTVNQWTGCGVKMNLKQSNWVREGHPPSVKKKNKPKSMAKRVLRM